MITTLIPVREFFCQTRPCAPISNKFHTTRIVRTHGTHPIIVSDSANIQLTFENVWLGNVMHDLWGKRWTLFRSKSGKRWTLFQFESGKRWTLFRSESGKRRSWRDDRRADPQPECADIFTLQDAEANPQPEGADLFALQDADANSQPEVADLFALQDADNQPYGPKSNWQYR